MRFVSAVTRLVSLALVVAFARDRRGLRRLATTDRLTGLPNRAVFERRAAAALARAARDGSGACLVVVDLDGFKMVNDTIGHAAGDRALVAAAVRLSSAVRGTDLVARWGGDEFVLLLHGISDERVVRGRAGAIARSVADIPIDGGGRLAASVGAAISPNHGVELATLLDAADRAMYEAKSSVAPPPAPRFAVAREGGSDGAGCGDAMGVAKMAP